MILWLLAALSNIGNRSCRTTRLRRFTLPAGALTRGILNLRSFYREFELRVNRPATELDSADLDFVIPSGTPMTQALHVKLGLEPCSTVVEHLLGPQVFQGSIRGTSVFFTLCGTAIFTETLRTLSYSSKKGGIPAKQPRN